MGYACTHANARYACMLHCSSSWPCFFFFLCTVVYIFCNLKGWGYIRRSQLEVRLS